MGDPLCRAVESTAPLGSTGSRPVVIRGVSVNVVDGQFSKAGLVHEQLGVRPQFFLKLRCALGARYVDLASQGEPITVPPGEAKAFDIVICPDPDDPVVSNPIWIKGSIALRLENRDLALGDLDLSMYNIWYGGIFRAGT
jgi:hypothetical protein